MDSDEDESFDERPATYDDSVLKHQFQSWLTNFATSCRQTQRVSGPLSEVQLYRKSALATSVNSRVPGNEENLQTFPDDQNERQQPIRINNYADETLLVMQRISAVLNVVHLDGHPNEAVDEGHTFVSQYPKMCRDAAEAWSRDAETQTSIVFEGWKETSDPRTATSNLPDVIYSSSESSAHSLPTSPDVLSNGAFKGHEATTSDLVVCEAVGKPSCSEEATSSDLSSMSSDASLHQNPGFASAIGGQSNSQILDAGKEVKRQFSSGYTTQWSRQSENSRSTSCDDGSSVFSQPESTRVNLDPTDGTLFATGATLSMENLSSSDTVINWAGSLEKDSTTSYYGNLPDFKQLLSDKKLKNSTSKHSVRDLLTGASGLLEMAVANDDEAVAADDEAVANDDEAVADDDEAVADDDEAVADDDEVVSVEIPVRQEMFALNEEMWDLEIMDQRLADYALQLINQGLNLAEVEQNLLEGLNQLPAQNPANEEEDDASMEIWSWSEEAQLKCIRHLQIAAACGDKDCSDDCCLFFQELLNDLEDHLRTRTLLHSHLHLQLLRSIVDHSVVCSEIHCTMPFCLFFHRSDFDEPEEQISRLLVLYSAFDFGVKREINVTQLDAVEFIQLDEETKWPSIESKSKSVPESDSDFEFLAPSAQFGRVSFYALSLGIVPKLLYIEMKSAIDERHVWHRLRGLQHPNIVHLLWVYVSCSQAVICSDALTYGDKSLEDVMKERRMGLPLSQFIQFTASILSAAEYLNRNDVLYLLWTADSVGLMGDGWTVRLRDFSCAVNERRATSDDGELAELLCSALPPVIVSPEMFENDIGRHCDVWGIGCLMFHLAHGYTVHHDLRHHLPDDIRTKVQQLPLHSILRFVKVLPIHNILSQVFVEKSQRLKIQQLQEQVLQLQAS